LGDATFFAAAALTAGTGSLATCFLDAGLVAGFLGAGTLAGGLAAEDFLLGDATFFSTTSLTAGTTFLTTCFLGACVGAGLGAFLLGGLAAGTSLPSLCAGLLSSSSKPSSSKLSGKVWAAIRRQTRTTIILFIFIFILEP